MRPILVILACFFSISLFSQQTDTDSSSVVIHKDPRIDLLIKKQAEINDITTRDSRKVGKGFRLLIVNTNKRDEAINAKAKLYQYFPELKSYLLYQSPYYKLKAGNFKERKDAEAYQKKLTAFFPNGVFVMNDLIEVKPDE
ncbi:MAG TPA: SPOR domain-containing protein [Chitinophagaceae bacterium]|jgi:hypothetical protein